MKEREHFEKMAEITRSATKNQQDLHFSIQSLSNKLLEHEKSINIEMELLQNKISVLSLILEKRYNYLVDEYKEDQVKK